MITYWLVLALGYSMVVMPEAFVDEQACQLAGTAFKIEAVQQKERRPRFFCIAVEARGE